MGSIEQNPAVTRILNADGTTVGTPTNTNIASGTLSGIGQVIGPFDASNYRMGYFSVTGTFSLTFTLEASWDGGTAWNAWPYHGIQNYTTGWQTSNAGSTSRMAEFFCAPVLMRVRCSAYTSGTATVKVFACGAATFPNILNTYSLTAGYIATGSPDNATFNNPVKIGGVAAGAVPANGTAGNIVNTYYDLAGRLGVFQGFKATNVTSATTTTVTNAKYLNAIVVNSTAAGTITIYDNTSAAGTKVGTLKSSIVEGTYTYNTVLSTGLTVVTGAASDITIISA